MRARKEGEDRRDAPQGGQRRAMSRGAAPLFLLPRLSVTQLVRGLTAEVLPAKFSSSPFSLQEAEGKPGPSMETKGATDKEADAERRRPDASSSFSQREFPNKTPRKSRVSFGEEEEDLEE